MSLKDPVHLLFGYVEICAESGFPERFINLCTAEGIPLWDMRKSGEKIFAKTTVSGYKKIRMPARKSSMRVRMVKKHGIPFAVDRALRHTGLVIGFSVMLVVLAFLSGRIWIIEVDNRTDIPSSEIVRAYENAGLKIGISKRTDIDTIRSDAIAQLEKASWTTVNISGSVATIKINEVNKVPELNRASGTSNIVALKDGQVEIIEPYRGSSAVKTGQTVMKGELLISGVTESRIQNYIFSDADGYVVASTYINTKTETPKTAKKLIPTTRKVYSIYFLGREIPLGMGKDSQMCYLHTSRLNVGGKNMPFGINYRLYTDFKEKETSLSENEQKLTAINDFALDYYHNTLHAQEISREINLKKSGNKTVINGRCFCYENIGKKVTFSTEETTENDDEKN